MTQVNLRHKLLMSATQFPLVFNRVKECDAALAQCARCTYGCSQCFAMVPRLKQTTSAFANIHDKKQREALQMENLRTDSADYVLRGASFLAEKKARHLIGQPPNRPRGSPAAPAACSSAARTGRRCSAAPKIRNPNTPKRFNRFKRFKVETRLIKF